MCSRLSRGCMRLEGSCANRFICSLGLERHPASRGTGELDEHTQTHTVFGLITQGLEGLSAGGLPGSHRAGIALVSACQSSKAALRRCSIEKLVPSFYSYLHLSCLPSATEELRATMSSQAPSAQKLQHKITKGIIFLAGSSPHSPLFQSPSVLSKCKAFSFERSLEKRWFSLWEEEMSEEKQLSKGKSLCSPQVCWQSEIMRCSWEEKCHCTISQSSGVSFRGIQMPKHPTESPNK